MYLMLVIVFFIPKDICKFTEARCKMSARTLMVQGATSLSESERVRVVGFVINRFRGSLFLCPK